MAESACLQCISWGFNWRNRAFQAFLTPNLHFWQMTQISDKCLLCKTKKTQISGQAQIIWVRWSLCVWAQFYPDLLIWSPDLLIILNFILIYLFNHLICLPVALLGRILKLLKLGHLHHNSPFATKSLEMPPNKWWFFPQNIL